MNNWKQVSLSLLALALFACGGDSNSDPDARPGSGPDADTTSCTLMGSGTADLDLKDSCDQATLLGSIVLEVGNDFSFLDAKIHNAVLPSSIREEEMSMGGCRLMRKRFPNCDPACTSDQACTFEGTCVPFPERQDMGDICVAGLADAYVMTAEGPGYHYFNTQVAHPAFAGGERIEVRSSGAAYDAFAMAGVGVTKIVPTDSEWSVGGENDLVVSWETSATDAHSTIYLTLNVDQHGTSPLLLECNLPDNGQATVPAAMIGALLTSGVSGFPAGKIERHTADSVTVSDGCIDFIVRSPTTVDVSVDGHTPCTMPGTSQCPEGQTCNVPIQTCEDI